MLHSQKSTGPFQAVSWKRAVTGPWTACIQDVAHPRPVYRPFSRAVNRTLAHVLFTARGYRPVSGRSTHVLYTGCCSCSLCACASLGQDDVTWLQKENETDRALRKNPAACHKRSCWSKKTTWRGLYSPLLLVYLWTEKGEAVAACYYIKQLYYFYWTFS